MRQVYSDRDYTRVAFVESMLNEAGISCLVRNANSNLIMASSEGVFWPELCVMRDEDYDRAWEIVESYLALVNAPETPGPDWQCGACGESNPAGFGSCWNCQTLRQIE